MKKHQLQHAGFFLALLALVFNVGIVVNYEIKRVNAGGSNPASGIRLTPNKSSAVANGIENITFTVKTYGVKCNQPYPDGTYYVFVAAESCDNYGGVASEEPLYSSEVTLEVSGTGNALSATQIATDESGVTTFTLASSTAESKTVTATNHNGIPIKTTSSTVTFTAPVSTNSNTSTKKPTATTSQTAQTPVVEQKTVSNVAFNNQVASSDANNQLSFYEDEAITLTGTAAANSKVRVYVFSEPQMAETTADKDGKWTVTLPKLTVGDHHVESAVVGNDDKEGERQQLGAFKVLAVINAPSTSPAVVAVKKTTVPWKMIIPIVVVSLLAVGYIGWYWWHHRSSILAHHKAVQPDSTSSTDIITPAQNVSNPLEISNTTDTQPSNELKK